MKMNRLSRVAVALTVGLVLAACGSDEATNNNDDNGGGGAPPTTTSNSEAIEALEAEIARLEKALKKAAAADRAALEKQLKDAQDRLAELEGCGEKGCVGIRDTIEALTAISDAYCEHVFACCSEEEVRASITSSVDSVQSCKALYSGLIGQADSNIDGPPGVGRAVEFGEAVEAGRVALDGDAISACAESVAAQTCQDEDLEAVPAVCGAELNNPCQHFVVGLQEAGEECFDQSECIAGLICDHSARSAAGVCVTQSEVDHRCVRDADCGTADSSLYCDEVVGKCRVKAEEGDDCVFKDPHFVNASISDLSVPCMPDLSCGVESKKCESACVADAQCSSNGECNEGLTCNFRDTDAPIGFCSKPAKSGAVVEVSSECSTQKTFLDDLGMRCVYVAGQACTSSAQCKSNSCGRNTPDKCDEACETESDCKSGQRCTGEYCVATPQPTAGACDDNADCSSDVCLAGYCQAAQSVAGDSCDDDDDCSDNGSVCFQDVCYPAVANGDACSVSEQCGATSYCDIAAETPICVAKLAIGADCAAGGAQSCASGLCSVEIDVCVDFDQVSGKPCSSWEHCASERCDSETDVCVIRTKKAGDACDMEAATGGAILPESIKEDPCQKGTYCKRNAPSSNEDYSGICTPQGHPGELCDSAVHVGVRQCSGNVVCQTSPAPFSSGERVCPVISEIEGEVSSCVLSVARNNWGNEQVRLVDGTNRSGRVEVFHDGRWGTVCDDGFTETNARVLCSMLGFSGGTVGAFGQGSDDIWLDNVSCTGNESSFLDCSHNGWGSHNCSHSEDVGVSCL